MYSGHLNYIPLALSLSKKISLSFFFMNCDEGTAFLRRKLSFCGVIHFLAEKSKSIFLVL